jgi:hypothetical protein
MIVLFGADVVATRVHLRRQRATSNLCAEDGGR